MAAKVVTSNGAASVSDVTQSSSSSNSTPNSSVVARKPPPTGTLLKTPTINKSASLPEHILDNVTSPLSKIDQEKLANAVAGTTQNLPPGATPTEGGSDRNGHTRKDSSLSVGGLSFNGVTTSAHCPKMSWDSNNGAESGIEFFGNGGSAGSDYSNLEMVSSDSKIGRLFSKHFPDLGEVPIKHANYSCSLLIKDSIPYHGRLYLTPAWICFYSKLFKKQLAVSLREVIMIKKEKSAFVVPNAIKVVSNTQKLVFGSLFHRHVTFKLMTVLWSRNCCDRALIDYDQMSLDSTTDKTGASSVPLENEEEEEDSLLDTSVSISVADLNKPKSESFSVGSNKNIDIIFSPSCGIRDNKINAADVSSSADEMVSADERTLFSVCTSNGAPGECNGKGSSPPRSGESMPTDPCDDDESYGVDRCSTVVRVVKSSNQQHRLSTSEEKKLVVASNACSIEQMSEPYQLTATVRYRPMSSSSNPSCAPIQATIPSQPRPPHMGGTPLGGGPSPHSGVKKTAAVVAALSSDSGSPPTGTRNSRRSDYQNMQGTRMDKGGCSSRGGGVRSRNEGGTHSVGEEQNQRGTAGHQQWTPYRSMSSRDSQADQPPNSDNFYMCHQCHMSRSQSVSYEGLYLLLFTIVLFFLLVTSLVLIWQLHHLSKSLHHHQHHTQQYEQDHQRHFPSSSSSASFPQEQKGTGDFDEQLMSVKGEDPLVQLVLHSCAMKQATSEYLARNIEANNLLLNGLSTQLERVAQSFEVSQENIAKLVQLKLEEKKQLEEQEQNRETRSCPPADVNSSSK